MNFKYFKDPMNFSYISDKPVACSICNEIKICFDAGGYIGVEEIDYICEDCLASGKLIDLDIESNLVYAIDSSDEESLTIAYKTPAFPTWQDTAWPVVNGQYPLFERIASKEDFKDKQEFVDSFIEDEQSKSEIGWLWDMLPDKKLNNYEEAGGITVYLFSLDNRKYWIWDAN